MRTVALVLALLGAAAAQQVTNTASLHLGGGAPLPSNTVRLRQGPVCAPALTPDSALPPGGLALATPGSVFVPYTLRLDGAAGDVTLDARVEPGAAWTPTLAVFLDADRDGRPDGAAPALLTLRPGEERALLLGASAASAQAGSARIALSAECGGRRAEQVADIQAQPAETALLLGHSTSATTAEIGDRVQFTLALRNPLNRPLEVELEATLPDHAQYLPDAGDGLPEVTGGILRWRVTLAPAASTTVTYGVRVLRMGGDGTLTSVATARSGVADQRLSSPPTTATVTLRAGVFDQHGSLIGRVYVDQDGNGHFGPGDRPVKGARVLLPNGVQVLTDAQGQYSVRRLAPGAWLVGLDRATVPGEPAGDALQRQVEVSGLARADFALRPGPVAAAPVPAAPAPAAPTGLIRRPLPGTVLHSGSRTAVSLEGPAAGAVSLRVNGVEVPDSAVGLRGPGAVPGSVRLEYVGVPLAEGVNVLEARFGEQSEQLSLTVAGAPRRLAFRPVQLVADGHTPLQVEIAALDERGTASGSGFLTLGGDLEPLEADAAPTESGHQVALHGGVARVTLAPQVGAREFTLRATLGSLSGEARLYARAQGRGLALYQGSVGLRVAAGEVAVTGAARGYLERPLAGGQLRAALDTAGLPGQDDLARAGVTGSQTEAQSSLRSDDGFALRYDRADFSVGYYAAPSALPGLDLLPGGSALRAELRGPVRLQAFAGAFAAGSLSMEFTPSGSLYRLSAPARPGSERVLVRTAGRDRLLSPGQDYVLDASGLLVLASPLAPTDAQFLPVRLLVTFTPATTERVLGAGLGAEYRRGPWSAQFGAAYVQQWSYSVGAAYRTPDFSVGAAYRRDRLNPDGRLTAELSAQQGPAQVTAALSAAPGEGVLGTVSAAYRAGQQRLTLRQRFDVGGARSELALERRAGALTLGAGVDYDWPTGTFGALGLARYDAGRLAVDVTHAQPFGVRAPETRVSADYRLSDTLGAQARLRQRWGQGATGEIGLRQRVGSSNFSVGYLLPGASGERGRARAGLELPLTLSARWSANLGASVERDLSSGAFSSNLTGGLRYHTAALLATLSGEYGLAAGVGRATLRGSVAGSPGPDQTLSVDASAELLPTPQGKLAVSYALRRETFAVLTTHRLQLGSSPALEGEAQANVTLSPALDLQPTFAYRVPLADRAGSSLQFGLGATARLTESVGVGATGSLLWQPALGTWAGALGLDARYRLADPLWLVAGYTWSGFTGLTGAARNGLHIRLDFAGGHP